MGENLNNVLILFLLKRFFVKINQINIQITDYYCNEHNYFSIH